MFLDELNFGEEIRGKVCPECGGSVLRRNSSAYCDEDGYVQPIEDPAVLLEDEE